jgi:hypothetical protein
MMGERSEAQDRVLRSRGTAEGWVPLSEAATGEDG